MDARPLEISARPSPIEVHPAHTAVLVVDMQNDFASPGGMFAMAGIDVTEIRAIVEPIASVLSAARRVEIPVVYLKMGFQPDLADAKGPSSPVWVKHLPYRIGAETQGPDGRPSRVLIRDTWNTDIVAGLEPHPNDLVLNKNRYSGFHDTGLDRELRARDVDTLIVVGATCSVCVESTVRDAVSRDYRCLLVEDCTAEPIGADLARTNLSASLLVLELLFAWVTHSRSVVGALQTLRPASSGDRRVPRGASSRDSA
jgi:ureidoacrylate peracid hydrolase